MIILSVDPATKTGASIVDYSTNEFTTAPFVVSSSMPISQYEENLENFIDGVKIDFAIIERPFFIQGKDPQKNMRSLPNYITHWRIVQSWILAIEAVTGIMCIETKKNMSKGQIVYPKKWQNGMNIDSYQTSGSKAKAKLCALHHFDGLSRELSFDEYDSLVMNKYKWFQCRDLGVPKGDEIQTRLFEAMRQSGAILPTYEEYKLLKGE